MFIFVNSSICLQCIFHYFQFFFSIFDAQLVESKIFEILLALSQDATLDASIKEAVMESLEKAREWDLIKAAPKED